MKQELNTIYRQVTFYFVLTAVLAWFFVAFMLVLRKVGLDVSIVVATSLWTMYLCRVALIVMVDISSFPAINHLYLMPAFPILAAATFMTLAALVPVYRDMRQHKVGSIG
jgi:hypothetical protein